MVAETSGAVSHCGHGRGSSSASGLASPQHAPSQFVALGDGELDSDRLLLRDSETCPLGLALSERDSDSEGETDSEADADKDGETDSLMLALRLALRLSDKLGLTDTDTDGLTDSLALSLRLEETDGDRL